MLVARDQENRVAHHHHGCQMQPKTPGQKIPLNDENAGHLIGGAKSILGGRSRGNENTLNSKGFKKLDKSSFVTPMEPRTRAVLGDKTTNAKAKGTQSVNGKSAARELDNSQMKAPTTVRPRQKQSQAEIQKLEVHTEEADSLSEEEVEYCPPKPKDLPYESDVFPDGVLTFEALKPENLFQGYYDYYFNPVDENGVSLADRQLEGRNRKAAEECDRRVQQDMDDFDWSIGDIPASKDFFKKKTKQPAPANEPNKPKTGSETQLPRKPLSTVTSRNAVVALSMDDGTKSVQRKAIKPIIVKKKTAFALPRLNTARRPVQQPANLSRKTSMEIRALDANSRSTIGYNKGRATASALAKGTTKPPPKRGQFKPKGSGLPRSETTSSTASDRTITPARYADKRAAEEEQWKERVPFLAIFNPDDDSDLELTGPGLPLDEEEEDEFQMQLPE